MERVSTSSVSNKLKVYVRIRPPLQREIVESTCTQCLAAKGNRVFISKSNKPLLIREGMDFSGTEVEYPKIAQATRISVPPPMNVAPFMTLVF